MFISILNMFRAPTCSSSGESIISIQNLLCVTLCRWPSSMQVRRKLPTCILDGHLHRVTYQELHWHNWFSWWWARGCSKHVENWNKHIRKKIVCQVGHLQELYWDGSTVNRSYWDKFDISDLTGIQDTAWPPKIFDKRFLIRMTAEDMWIQSVTLD
jgi:hypothetical protein